MRRRGGSDEGTYVLGLVLGVDLWFDDSGLLMCTHTRTRGQPRDRPLPTKQLTGLNLYRFVVARRSVRWENKPERRRDTHDFRHPAAVSMETGRQT